MSNSKRQIKTDATIESILEANATQVLENNRENVPSDEQRVLGAKEQSSVQKLHVDDQGFLTTKNAFRNKRSK